MKLISEQMIEDIIGVIVNAKHDFKFAEIHALIVALENLPLGEEKKNEKIDSDSTTS